MACGHEVRRGPVDRIGRTHGAGNGSNLST